MRSCSPLWSNCGTFPAVRPGTVATASVDGNDSSMWTRYLPLAIVPVYFLVASRFTHISPDFLVVGLLSMSGGLTGAYLYLSAKALGPAGRPPPLTGPPLAKAGWVAGSVGELSIRRGYWVTVYADRLVIGISFLATRTVMADQLGLICAHGAPRPEIRIEHTAVSLVSPITLRLREDHPVRQALREMVSR